MVVVMVDCGERHGTFVRKLVHHYYLDYSFALFGWLVGLGLVGLLRDGEGGGGWGGEEEGGRD